MRWRLDTPLERVDSRDAIVVLKSGASLAPDDFSRPALDDLLRSALVFGVSGLDRYVHERVVKKIIASLGSTTLTRRQEELAIPATMALAAAKTLRRALGEGKQARPANEIRKKIQENLHTRPFQSWRQIEEAFELIGVTDLAQRLQAAYRVGDFGQIRRELDAIVRHRNQIVHEGALARHKRGGTVRSIRTSRGYVEQSLRFLDDFCQKLEEVV